MQKEKVTQERLLGMQAGIAELQSRLLDLIRSGLVELDLTPPQSREVRDLPGVQYFEEFAARMVDAQLGNIGKKIRYLATFRELYPQTWHERLLDELGELYIFSKAFQKFDALTEKLQDELLSQSGVTTRTTELFQEQGIKDDWLVLGQVTTSEPNNLTSRRTWLVGKECQKIVLALDYTFGSNDFTTLWLKGMAYTGEGVYYPASYSLRMAFKTIELTSSFSQVIGYETIESFLKDYAEALSQNPWLPQFPALLTCVIPVFQGEKFLLVDKEKKQIYTEGVTSKEIGKKVSTWELVALSGGKPITVFGEWDGSIFRWLNCFTQF